MSIEVKPSDLQMEHFTVPFLQMHWEDPQNDLPDPRDLFSLYPIEIELEASESDSHPSEFFVFLELRVNQKPEKLAGYQLRVVGNGYFKIDNFDQLPTEVIHNFKTISAVSIMINTLRAVLSDMTSYAPRGRYNLPAIDILAVLNSKAKQEAEKNKTVKGSRKKKDLGSESLF